MEFNPYTEWLAIPPAQTPPNHYRLLGVKDFEPSGDKIHAAALAQIARLRLYQTGENADASQRLMNEVSQARIVLTDPAKRAEYDLKLQGHKPSEKSTPAFEPPPLVKPVLTSSAPSFIEESVVDAEVDSSDEEEASDWLPEPSSSRFATLAGRSPIEMAIRASIGTIFLLALVVATLLYLRTLPTSPSPSAEKPSQEVVEIPTPTVEEEPEPAPPTPPPVAPEPPKVEPVTTVVEEPTSTPPPRSLKPGQNVLWQWQVGEEVPVGAMIPVGEKWDQDNQGAKLSLQATGQQRVYWPAPFGSSQIAVHFTGMELNDPHQSLALGGIDEQSAFVGMTLGVLGDKIVVTTQAGPRSPGPMLSLPSAANFWAVIQFHGDKQWSVIILDENGAEHARQDFKSDLRPRLWKCELTNNALASAIVRMAEVRLEGPPGTSTPLWYLWPRTIYWPPVDTILSELGGIYESAGPANFTSRYSFDSPEERARWNSRNDKEGTANPLPGKRINLGPVHRIEWFRARLRFVERTTTFRIDFSDGPSIVVEGTTGKVKLHDAVLTEFDPRPEFFDLAIPLTQPVPNTPASPRDRPPTPPIPVGQATLTLLQGEIEVDDFQYEGDLNFMPIWIKSLRPLPEKKIVGSYEYLDAKPGYRSPFQVKGDQIARVEAVGTPGDETFPYVSPDGLDLFYASETDNGLHMYCARRSDPGEPFDVVTKLPTPEGKIDVIPGSLTPNGLVSIFAIRASNGATTISTLERSAVLNPFRPPADPCVIGLRAQEATPQLSPDGLRLIYSRRKQDEYELVEIVRSDLGRPFLESNAKVVPFGKFRHPSLAPDNATLYIDGPTETGQHAIYVATRPDPSKEWSTPRILDRLQSNSTKKGNVTPRISPDGRFLFFASDREGSAGGFDIWVTSVSSNSPAENPSPAAEPEVIGDWLILGPLSPPPGQENSLDDIKKTMQRRDRTSTPRVGDEAHGLKWRRESKITGGKGIYLVMFPFQLEKSLDARVEIRSVPGAAIFWLANDEAVSAAGVDPWSPPDHLPAQGTIVSMRKGLNRLAGVICTAGDAEIRVRLLQAESDEPLSGVAEEFR